MAKDTLCNSIINWDLHNKVVSKNQKITLKMINGMESKKTLLEKVKWVASTIEIEDDQKHFQYFEDMMTNCFANDPELPIIRDKMENLISLLNTKLKGDKDEYEAFMDLDFETEIFHMI